MAEIILFYPIVFFFSVRLTNAEIDVNDTRMIPPNEDHKYLRAEIGGSGSAVLSPLYVLKGMTSHPLNSSLQTERENNPQVFRCIFLVAILFLLITTTIVGMAGIVFILIQRSKNKGSVEGEVMLYGFDDSDAPSCEKHPGCIRVISQTHDLTSLRV